PLTMTLLGVVALDDMLGIVLFTLALVAAGGAGEHQLLSAFWEIGGAIALGSAMGCLLGWFGWRVEQEDLRLPVVAGSILLAVGLANLLHLSPLLTCMLLGLVSKEFFGPRKTQQWLRPMTHIQELIFLTLFTLAGTHFEPAVFVDSLGFVATYAFARVVGKVVGAWLGTTMAKAPAVLRHRLGFALLPQAGVSIGLALVASGAPGLEEVGPLIVNTILGTTILFELVAPILTKIVLIGAGEAKQ
ncbi:MAG: cation:proton antiporter, partial [Phycisphaeraceae bacterium]